MRRFFLLLFLLPLDLYAQGAGTPPYRGLNNWSLIFGTDNEFDIGAVSSQRPRTGYFGTSVVTPALTVSGLTSGRVPFATTGGLFTDASTLAFNSGTGTLTATNLTSTTAVTAGSGTWNASALTSVVPVLIPDGTAGAPSVGFATDADGTGTGFYRCGGSYICYTQNGTQRIILLSNVIQIRSDGTFEWCPSASLGCGPDAGMARHAAGVVAVRSGATSVRTLLGGGASVASASALPVPTGSAFHVTGTTGITSITSTNLGTGVCITLIFDGTLTVTDGSNLKLAGDFNATADDTLGLCFDGTNWYETHRSAN